MLDLTQIFRNFTTWTTVTWVSTMLVARVFDFHKAYTMIIDKLDKEKWLMEQCLSDEFYHRLAYHSDLCEVTKCVVCKYARQYLIFQLTPNTQKTNNSKSTTTPRSRRCSLPSTRASGR